MAEVGRDLWKSPGLTLLLKQGHLQQVAQDHVQMALEDLQWWRLQNLSGQPVQVAAEIQCVKGCGSSCRTQGTQMLRGDVVQGLMLGCPREDPKAGEGDGPAGWGRKQCGQGEEKDIGRCTKQLPALSCMSWEITPGITEP